VGAAPGAAIGAIIGGVGGIVTGAITTTIKGVSTKAEKEALDILEKEYLKDNTILQKIEDGLMTDADWDSIGIEDEALRASLQENADKVSELVKEMAVNTNAINA
jgi:hypothetical protein